MFRPNIVRVCQRLHVGVKSTMVQQQSRFVPMATKTTTTTTTTRHFAANANMPSTASNSTAGGSAFVPSGILRGWYNTFGQSTAKYASFLILLIIVGEYTFEGITNSLWTWNNKGHTFETTDWSPFDEIDEDEEEEEEEEVDEEEDDDE